MRRYALRDDQCERINDLPPFRCWHVGVTPKRDRLSVDAIKLHTRFSRWAESGVWKKVFEILAADADNEYAMIDSTIVRAHQHSAGAQKKMTKTRRSGAARVD